MLSVPHIDYALSHHVFQTSNIPVEYFFLPMVFGLGLLMCVALLSSVLRTALTDLSQLGRDPKTRRSSLAEGPCCTSRLVIPRISQLLYMFVINVYT
jgi:hypothetical protein